MAINLLLLLLRQENVDKDVDRVGRVSFERSINFKVLAYVRSMHAGVEVEKSSWTKSRIRLHRCHCGRDLTESRDVDSHVSEMPQAGTFRCSYTRFLRPYSIAGSQPVSDQMATDGFCSLSKNDAREIAEKM